MPIVRTPYVQSAKETRRLCIFEYLWSFVRPQWGRVVGIVTATNLPNGNVALAKVWLERNIRGGERTVIYKGNKEQKIFPPALARNLIPKWKLLDDER